jgi:hypothetical protein
MAHFRCGHRLRIVAAMKQTKIVTGTERGDSVSINEASRELDPVLIKFVETLAIADARRDHLAMNGLVSKQNPDAASTSAGLSTNDARRHLCTIFDRASERKID